MNIIELKALNIFDMSFSVVYHLSAKKHLAATATAYIHSWSDIRSIYIISIHSSSNKSAAASASPLISTNQWHEITEIQQMVLNSVETYRNLRLFFRCIEHFVAHPHANLSPIHTDFAWVFCVSSFLCGVVVMSQCNKSYKLGRSFITFVVI